jgi:hypothetical protein
MDVELSDIEELEPNVRLKTGRLKDDLSRAIADILPPGVRERHLDWARIVLEKTWKF